MKKQNRKGFSLLELVLVLGVGSMMAFMRFQDMKNEQETMTANAVGQQMKQIGEAVNGYINIRYDKLSTLTSSSSQSSDPGPRVCNASGCEITYQTLVNEGLLPALYTGINAQKSSYKIILKRSGISPNYVVNGLITTTLPWMEGDKYRYDLLGRAMQAAGIDSGMTQSATLASGLQGAWKETSTDYSNITSAGLMAYRVGYDSAMYSVYLRRDGTLPMTGDLNMGGQSINNVQDITAAGTATANTLNSTGDTVVGAHIRVGGSAQVNGSINANNSVSAQNIQSRGEVYTQNWFRTLNDGGIYFQKYGGGWYMKDANTITAYNGKNVQTTGGILSGYVKVSGSIEATGNIHSDKTIDANYFLPNSTEVVGTACPTQGLISKESTGAIISCQDGIWRRINYAADAPKPLKIILSCHAGNNSSNSCRKDVYTDLTFWRDGITRPEIKLVSERITRWWGDGCGSCYPGSFTYSNGVIQMSVNQAFVEREFTLSW
ncbi:shufflon system plasmid conjugative transfer pilus tip adhesin PilV [Klebsiella michiganensis]|uniref:shufflon system plasmid conjugative transfer pilus tip adhesin PilV n=1 Tax=Klebsiella michiganensis TaxID=1134687 RepID=UPI00374C37DE